MTDPLRCFALAQPVLGALALCCAAPQTAHAFLPLLPEVVVLSPRSPDGSFTVLVRYVASSDDCPGIAESLTLDSQTELSVTEVATCEYRLTPEAPLAAGHYCLRNPNDASEPMVLHPERSCFEVTGAVMPEWDKVELTPGEVRGAALSDGLCRPCSSNPNIQLCTRSQIQQLLEVTLSGLPAEAGVDHVFAFLPRTGPEPVATPTPSDDDFHLLQGLSQSVYLDEPTPEQVSCITAYAREIGSSGHRLLGTVCIEHTTQASLVEPYAERGQWCVDEYRSAWCQDNRAECSAEGAPEACEGFHDICPEAVEEPQDDASAPGEAGDGDGDAARSKSSTGCQVAAGPKRELSWWPLLAFAALMYRRSSRRRLRSHA